ncbi:glycosyltransferase family 2 protein [Cellulomonas sp. P22]|uniref:glycosyltransferase family 2 protein n=1 Tax=Cellulomonas sp. P22 TaxID=3373189 RepID=UPI00379E816D
MTDSPLLSGLRLAEAPATSRSAPAVTAVVVTRGPSRYLAPTLQALGAQTRTPARVLVVDVAEHAGGDVLRLTRGALAGLRPDAAPEIVAVQAPGARTFGDAVRSALADIAPPTIVAAPRDLAGTWLWLLHDDSAPEPDALAELLRAVEHAPSVGVAGVKQYTWTEPARLLEVGVRTSRSGRRMTGVEDAEVDQGQHDGREDVLGVGIAGALVRRDVWDELGGPDPALGPFGDGFDLSRRARLAGHRVVVVPAAVVRHAQASYHGLRGTSGAGVEVDADADGLPDAGDPRRSFAARRRALVHQRLVTAPLLLLPFVAVLALLSAPVRALVRVATKEPLLALTELAAPLRALGRPGAVLGARRRARRTRRLSRRTLRPLQASSRDVWSEWRDRRLAHAEARRVVHAPSELELRELAALTTRRRSTLGLLVVLLSGVTAVALGALVGPVAGGATLVGRALTPAAAGLAQLWQAATSGWVADGLGAPGPADPLLLVLLPVTALVGDLSRAVAVVLLGAVLLGGLGAWFAAGAATRSVAARLWAALVWAAAPALLVGLGDGRLGPVVAHLALPWLVLGLARATGTHQVDSVLSGVATARRDADPIDDDLLLDDDLLPDERRGPDGRVDDRAFDDGPQPAGDHTSADLVAADVVPPPAEPLPAELLPAEPLPAEPLPAEPLPVAPRTASVTAAAGAALAFAVMVAGAPSLLVPGLLVLVVVALCAPRGRFRVLLVGLPGLALLGPLLAEAVARGGAGLRLLVADPGLPYASTPATPLERLLGVPSDTTALAPDGLPAVVANVWPLAWGAVLLLVAVLALLRGAPVARGVRVAWCGVVAGLAVATVVGLVDVAVSDGAVVRGWPGAGVSFAGAGLLAAALLGVQGMRERLTRSTFGWRQPGAVLMGVLAGAVVVATLGGWAWQARTEGVGGLEALDRLVVPAVGQQSQAAPRSSRVLLLATDPDGVVSWQLVRGDGVLLADQSAAVWTRTVQGPLRGSAPAGADTAESGLTDVVARLRAATSGDVAADLAGFAVGDVLLPPVPARFEGVAEQDVDAVRAARTTARAELSARLDSTTGLERITESAAGTIWRVQAVAPTPDEAPAATISSWARVVGTDGDVVVPSDGRTVTAEVGAGDAERRLVLAERADQGWTATLDGQPLRAVPDEWRQAFALGAEGGDLVVAYHRADRTPWLVIQGTVLLLTVLLALPVRRRKAGRR